MQKEGVSSLEPSDAWVSDVDIIMIDVWIDGWMEVASDWHRIFHFERDRLYASFKVDIVNAFQICNVHFRKLAWTRGGK